jgi:hypothetical protein
VNQYTIERIKKAEAAKSHESHLKLDEAALMAKLRERHAELKAGNREHVFADSYFEELGIPYNRGEYILEKFSRFGMWNYGVTCRSGWLEKWMVEPAKEAAATA